MEKFERLLGSNNPLLKSVTKRGFTVPSEIQEKSIPKIIEGHDVIAGASTGSGKTLAFAAGLINNVKKNYGIQGLVLTPTRELAEQITTELMDFAKHKDLDVLAVYGGISISTQIKRLGYADIVVGTPGRMLDHINRNSIDLSHVNTLVLDEADRMLDMGFRDDVKKIINKCPKKRQTLLFSATISDDVFYLIKGHMKNPIEISAKPHVDPKKLEQVYYDVEDGLKYSLLKHLLENEKSKLVMIFCNTRKNVDFVANNLNMMGIVALPIHGGYTQDKRNKIMEDFHSKNAHVLIATDVAARGLDIGGVSHVYNYDLPPNAKEYTHRIGRTARAGNEGKVINILSSRDYENFRNIKIGDFKIKAVEMPYVQKVRLKWMPNRGGRFDDRNSRGPRRGGSNFRGKNDNNKSNNSRNFRKRNYSKPIRRNNEESSGGYFRGRNNNSGESRGNNSRPRRDDNKFNKRKGNFGNKKPFNKSRKFSR